MTSENANEELPAGLGNVPQSALENWAPHKPRRWPFVVGGLLVILGGLVALGPSIVSGSWLNGVIRTWLANNVETPVSFDRLEVSWSDGIRISGLAVSDRVGRDDHLLYVREVELQASIASLFVRHLDVERLVFHDATVRIEHEGGGRLNSEDVVKMERKKRKKKKDGDGGGPGADEPVEALVLPEIDVPIDVRNLTLVFVTEDGREISRPGITFRGDITTRRGPTTFSLAVPNAEGEPVLSVEGEATLFDAEGMLLPRDELAITTTLTLAGIDAADHRDLIQLFAGNSPASGVLEGRIDVSTKGRQASGDLDLVLRGLAVGDAVGTKAGDTEDLRIAGRFRADDRTLDLDQWTLRGEGLSADVDVSGAFDALTGVATFSGDLERSAAALQALGIALPEGLAGTAEGRFEFTPSPSRGEGRLRIEGLHVPPLGQAREALHIDGADVHLVLVPEKDRIVVEKATVSAPALTLTASGALQHDGVAAGRIDVEGDIAGLLAHGRSLGAVPRDLSLAGRLTGGIRASFDPAAESPVVLLDDLAITNDGMRLGVDGGVDANGALNIRLEGSGALQSLVAPPVGESAAVGRDVRGTFEISAALTGRRDAPHAKLERLVIAGDLDIDARGDAPPDGSLDGSLSVEGRVPDAISLARSLGLVEGDIPLDGAIEARLSVAGTRERPQVPVASLRVTGGPVQVDATATLDMDGVVGGSFRANAELDAIWRIARAQGFLVREYSTGGTLTAEGVLDGTRDAPEVPTATLRIDGPLEARLDASLDAAQEAVVGCRFRGPLGPISELLAAALDVDAHRVVGDYEGTFAVEGPLDALHMSLTHLAVRNGEFTADGQAALAPDGSATSAFVLRGPLASALDLARVVGVARDVDATGTLDTSVELRLTGPETARSLVGAVSAAVFDLRLSHGEGGDAAYVEEEIRLSIPSLRLPLGKGEMRPMRAELRAGQRMAVEVTVARSGEEFDATAKMSGRMQPLVDAIAFAARGHAGRLAADIDAEIRLSGAPSALDLHVPSIRIVADDGSLDVDATASRIDGELSARATTKGDVFALLTLAQAAGVASDVRATGGVDAEIAVRGRGDALVVSTLRAQIDEFLVSEPKIGDGRFSEPRMTLEAPEFQIDLGSRAVTGLRPHLTLDGLDVTASIATRTGALAEDDQQPSGDGLEPKDEPLIVTTEGQIRLTKAFVANHPELFPDTRLESLETPFVFEGDVAAGRHRAATWTGSFDATIVGLVAPYVDAKTANVTGAIADGVLTLDPFTAQVNGGTASGTAAIGLVGEKPQHQFTLEADDVAISGELAPLLARISPLLAKGDAGSLGGRFGVRGASFVAKGLDSEVIKRTISGDGALVLSGVHVESNNWVGKVLDFVGAGTRLEVADAEVPFEVRRGRVTTGNVDIVGSKLDLRMGGTVGTDGAIDYTFGIKPRKLGGKSEKFAKLLDADGFLPLRLEGDIASPSLEFPSLADVAGGSIKGLLGGLKDKLGGGDKADDEKKDDDELSDEERKKRRRERRKRKKQREAEEAAKKADESGGAE